MISLMKSRGIMRPGVTGYVYFILLFIFASQSISLFRAYPPHPPCGQTVKIAKMFEILVNCDSAQFMKDADSPERLINGKSDYADRPMFAYSAGAFAKLIMAIGVRDHRREVLGSSGSIYSYSYITFAVYIIFNLLILFWAALLTIIPLHLKMEKLGISKLKSTLILLAMLFLLCSNEITKTFFWTPHSQIFNLLLASSAFYLLSTFDKIRTNRGYILINCIIGFGLFFYPVVGLLYFATLNYKFYDFRHRLFIATASLLPYIMYPRVLDFLGLDYKNSAISKFREFVWPIDGLNSKEKIAFFGNKLWHVFSSFPMIPTFIILITLISILIKFKGEFFTRKEILIIYFAALYLLYIIGIGLGERRISLGLIVFIGIALLNYICEWKELVGSRFVIGILFFLIIFEAFSWVFTSGPQY